MAQGINKQVIQTWWWWWWWDVTWPSSSVNNNFPLFNWTTGKIIKDSLMPVSSLKNLMSTSLTSACTMTIGTPTSTYNIPAFTAVFVDNYTNILSPVVTNLSYAGSTNNTVTNLATQDLTYISIDKNWTIYQTATIINADLLRDRVVVWALVHSSHTAVDFIDTFTTVNANDVAAAIADISDAIGIINNGNIFSANGANLKINKSSGTQTQTGLNSINWFKNPNIATSAPLVAPTIYQTWRDGSGWWVTNLSDTLVPWKYDNNTAWWVTSPNWVLNTNKWQLIKIYYVSTLNAVGIEYWQVIYNSEAEAEAARSTSTSLNPLFFGTSFRWWIVLRWWATNLSLTADAVFLDSGKFGSITWGTGSGSSTTTMQQSYDNSVTPQIVTTTTLGSVDLKRWTAADTDNVFRILNGAWSATATITGAWVITGSNLSGTNTGDQTSIVGITGTLSQFNTAMTDADITPTSRTISVVWPISWGGDLSADRTITTSMTTNKLIWRGTAGTWVMEEITLGTNLSFTGTTLNAAGGSFALTEDEIDFWSSIPVRSKRFTITNWSITWSSKIIVSPSWNVATGRVGNDWEWDSINFTAKAGTGNFVLTANASWRVKWKRKIFYSFS